MNGGSKYVPPAVRRGEGSGNREEEANGYDDRRGGYDDRRGGYDDRRGGYDDRRGGYDDRRGGYDDRRGGYDDRRGGGYNRRGGYDGYDQRGGYDGYNDRRGGYNDRRGGYDDRRGGGGNSRWSSEDDDRGYRGYGNRDRGGEGGYSGRGGTRTNKQGFHGDETPNVNIERELFDLKESQTTGINFDKYDDIPVEVSEGCPEPYNEFTADRIGETLLKNLILSKYTKPTPVQKYSIPIGLSGGDMMACAQTGSGKTAGFLFPVIAIMLQKGALPEPENSRRRCAYITALVLAPTRELASQIFDESQKFCYCTGIRPVVVYGGAPIMNQQQQIERGCDLVVATPGRLVDLIERGRIKLDIVQFLVLDEADRMLDMGFEPQIRRIVEDEGMPFERQTFMFSATFPSEIQRLAADFMKDYIFVAVGRVGAASKDVTQRVEWVEQLDKTDYVMDFLTRCPEGLVLVFVETKRGADFLEETLTRNNFPASSIHGDKSQREREDALRMFKSCKTPILVATDVAARGLDIPNVTQVINYDLPNNIEDYVHRIGRTGRVGNVGNALSLMNDKNRNIAKELAELMIENDQDCPEWLEAMLNASGGYNRGGRSGGRGGGRGRQFGARDYRSEGRSGAAPAPSRGGASAPASRSFGGPRYPDAGPRYPDSRDNSAW